MFDSHAFFKERFSAHLRETSRYLRYILNGHIAVAMLFFISALAFYYQQWLMQLPANFPTAWIIGIVLGLLVSYSPVRTLLKEPDLVFLIAAEHKMGAYFRDALIYSFVIQLYLIFIAVAAFGPLYFAAYPEREGYTYLLTLAIVLIFKVWNLIANWWMLKIRDKGTRQWDHIVRLAVNISVFYFLIEGSMLLAAITTVLFIALFLYDLNRSRKEAGIKWDLLVEKDQQRMQTFYRFANLFTDVPRLKNRVKKRYWLVSFVDKLPFKQQLTYDYLYRITFIRSGDYLGMYVRLIVIGGLFIYYVPNIWMKLLFALLFLYMSSFQMVTLYNHHRTVVWLDLYPVKRDLRQKALMKWLLHLAIIQTVVFSLVFIVAGNYMGSILTIVGGTVFDFLFIYGYVKKKLLHK
ncbi:ABC transporter permease [Virgibacillus alimentarius]|uniref:ABC-2 type transport system permease protein n=1 Tax=Virgibacillus alimentarius TaxID=698769 RepID=A0ABS4SBE4_9BACI|nr:MULTISPECIES: ABC transporter permease [Virgibacillus]MBP2258831.1 ABC-2 type transport system permease protein [Virgibacillus alimentarius]HLR65770.1 ABC transporter permease [Virgibacillus sp.]